VRHFQTVEEIDLAPTDYFLFPKLKFPLKGRYFKTVEDSDKVKYPEEHIQVYTHVTSYNKRWFIWQWTNWKALLT
jgi:hypothetical protein